MGKAPNERVQDFMAKYRVNADEVWEVRTGSGNYAIKHGALERIAAEQKIAFETPLMLEFHANDKIAVICVTGKLGERTEWSIGEAAPYNNKNAYPFAMAEKRAKDRVILKLLNTHGTIYSEEELDDRRPNPHVTRPADIVPGVEYDQHGQPVDNIPTPDEAAVQKLRVADQKPIFAAMQKEIHAINSIDELSAWAEANRNRLGALKPDYQEFLRGVYAEHRDTLRNGKAA
jgi:hypothetical protein